MTTPAQYLDQLQKHLGVDSDNALAPHLGVYRQTISRYRLGRGGFDDNVSVKVAEILGIHPGIVLLHMTAFRKRDPAHKKLWLDVARDFFQVVPPGLDRRRAPR